MSKDLAQRHWLQIEDFLKLADYVNAIQILNANIEIMLEHTPIVDLSRLVAQFPGELCHQNDDLCYVRAMVFARTDQQEESLRLLEQLRFRYRYTHQNYEKAVACCLELARIFISRERFQSALHYLSEEAEPLFAKGFINNPRLQAQLYLRKAEVFTDLGKLQEDYRYTHEAYALFQQLDDWKGQYYALTRLVFVLTQIGRYAEAAGKLDIAWTYYHRANLGDSAKARLLNFQIHLYWYQGKLQEAFDDGLRYRTLVDQQPASNFRVYARILQGNLQRGLGNYIEAENYYAETRALLVELNYPLFTPWVDAQSAWLRLLQGYYDDARRLIQSSLATSDLGQAMSFQITLAAIDLQTEQPVSAQRLLQESLLFYQNSGDELTVCVIHSYLALAAIRQAQPAEAISHLQRAMQWLSARHIDYFPHWWHPQMFADICVFALAKELYPDIAERILLHRLGKIGIRPLQELLTTELPRLRSKAAMLLRILTGEEMYKLPDNGEPLIQEVLNELLTSQKLRRDGYARLCRELTTAKQRATPNLTIVAVFGLFLQRIPREEIAQRLHCSVANVRNYITVIYNYFGISQKEYPVATERHARLVEIAREMGFL